MSFETDFVWSQYQKFSLDEIRLPFISNVLILDRKSTSVTILFRTIK